MGLSQGPQRERLELLFGNPKELMALIFKRLSILGIPVAEVAAKAGVTPATMTRYRDHVPHNMKLETFLFLLEVAGLRMRVETAERVDLPAGRQPPLGFRVSEIVPKPTDIIHDEPDAHPL